MRGETIKDGQHDGTVPAVHSKNSQNQCWLKIRYIIYNKTLREIRVIGQKWQSLPYRNYNGSQTNGAFRHTSEIGLSQFTADYIIRNFPWSRTLRSDSRRNSITLSSKFITASSAWSESCGLQRLLPTLSGFCVMRKSDSTEQHLPSHRLVTLLSHTCCYILVLANNAYSNNRSICFALLTECNVFPSKEFWLLRLK